MIENFGVFGPMETPERNGRGFYRPYFRPAQPLVEIVNQAPEYQPHVRRNHKKSSIPPLRAEDDEIIERWLRVRQGQVVEVATDAVLYTDPRDQNTGRSPRATSLWSPKTAATARRAMRAFARRCEVPLEVVGLVENPGLFGIYDPKKLATMLDLNKITEAQYHSVVVPLHTQINAYATIYSQQALPRLERLAASKYGTRDAVYRTVGWTAFVGYALDFYSWLEAQGTRPRGSNPVQGIKRHSPMNLTKEGIVVNVDWYQQVLEFPDVTARTRAIMYLLGNGLRRNEVAEAVLSRLNLTQGPPTLKIIGKRNKPRTVWLLPPTVTALERYLATRLHSENPHIFVTRFGKRIAPGIVYELITKLAARVFPFPEQDAMRRHIHPHGFRHYFISTGLDKGINRKALMEEVGHESHTMLARYEHVNDKIMAREIKKISRQPWFKVPL